MRINFYSCQLFTLLCWFLIFQVSLTLKLNKDKSHLLQATTPPRRFSPSIPKPSQVAPKPTQTIPPQITPTPVVPTPQPKPPAPEKIDKNFNYPIRGAYINKVKHWWPPKQTILDLGTPEDKDNKKQLYNFIILAFWTYSNGPLDTVIIWSDPVKYFGADSGFGSTKDQIQKFLKKKYNDNGIKILISAFGATQFPTTAGVDPIDCAKKLSEFVLNNNLDGVDIDWEDNGALQNGKGMDWLIKFQKQLSRLLPNHIITHAPQAPYFSSQNYKNKSYVELDKQVGDLISFYNVQFYNQESAKYDTYQTLFENSGTAIPGTSVIEISKKGVPLNKIVVCKPVEKSDASNTGVVDHKQLGEWVEKAYNTYHWYAGISYWQYSSDQNGKNIQSSAKKLIQACQKNKNCN